MKSLGKTTASAVTTLFTYDFPSEAAYMHTGARCPLLVGANSGQQRPSAPFIISTHLQVPVEKAGV